MKSVKTLALALVVGGLSATGAWADGGPGSPANTAQSLMPLPELSNSWSGGDRYPVVQTANYAPAPVLSEPAPPTDAESAPATSIKSDSATVSATPVSNRSSDVYDASLEPSTCTACTAGGNASGCGCNSAVSGEMAAMGCCEGPIWYGYVGGLIMTRNSPSKYWTTYNQANNADQVLNTAQADDGWQGGAEVRLGRSFGCDCALEATYWGVWNMHGFASVTDPGNNLGTPLDTTNGGITLGGQTADSFYASSHQTLIWRNDDVNNVELNWYYNPNGADTNACLQCSWLAGFRFLKFDEDLLWTSVAGGFNYNQNGGVDQASIDERCENNMWGFQIGSRVDWKISDHWSLYGVPKMGIYGNHATTEARFYRGDGVTAFDLNGSSDTVSFIGQLDLGLEYQVNCHWSITGGYRVVVISGVALSDNQIPAFLAAANDFTDVKTNADLVLHGAFAGLEYRF
jgi:opacity protein-like surface antigen